MLKAIYFDGRKDTTKVREEKDGKFYPKDIREEHVTILKEPEGEYLTHLAPKSGKSTDLAADIYDYITQPKFDFTSLSNCISFLLHYVNLKKD